MKPEEIVMMRVQALESEFDNAKAKEKYLRMAGIDGAIKAMRWMMKQND